MAKATGSSEFFGLSSCMRNPKITSTASPVVRWAWLLQERDSHLRITIINVRLWSDENMDIREMIDELIRRKPSLPEATAYRTFFLFLLLVGTRERR